MPRARHLLLTLAAALAALITVSTASPAHADVGCWGDYCSGMDPQATGCSADAITVAFVDIEAARLELRWSPTCKTNWARYQQYPRGWYLGSAPVELRAVQDTGYTQRLDYGVNGVEDGSTTWTPMIYSPVRWVHAELVVQCGGISLLDAAFDCATNGLIKTAQG